MKSAPSLSVSSEQRGSLEKMARSTSLPHRGVVQAKALLWAADGVANEEIARRCGVDSDAVRRWRRRFSELGVAGVGVIAKGRGRRSWLPEGTVAEVVRVTLEETPDDTSTHWTTRSLAKRFGIGKDTVARIWQDHHLQPWKVDTFKISTDPRFEEKLVDVVGLYLDPPERAVVFSFDEKTQCQALDRTQPSLPMKPGRAGTMTHDYKRNGTTDLFAALNVATGEVLYDCREHHTGKDVFGFLDVWVNVFNHVSPDADGLGFLVVLFTSAAKLSWLSLVRDTGRVVSRDVAAGLALGVPNFATTWFLLQGLKTDQFGSNSTAAYSVYSALSLVLTVGAGVVLWREQLTGRHLAGIAFAIGAILALGAPT